MYAIYQISFTKFLLISFGTAYLSFSLNTHINTEKYKPTHMEDNCVLCIIATQDEKILSK